MEAAGKHLEVGRDPQERIPGHALDPRVEGPQEGPALRECPCHEAEASQAALELAGGRD